MPRVEEFLQESVSLVFKRVLPLHTKQSSMKYAQGYMPTTHQKNLWPWSKREIISSICIFKIRKIILILFIIRKAQNLI